MTLNSYSIRNGVPSPFRRGLGRGALKLKTYPPQIF